MSPGYNSKHLLCTPAPVPLPKSARWACSHKGSWSFILLPSLFTMMTTRTTPAALPDAVFPRPPPDPRVGSVQREQLGRHAALPGGGRPGRPATSHHTELLQPAAQDVRGGRGRALRRGLDKARAHVTVKGLRDVMIPEVMCAEDAIATNIVLAGLKSTFTVGRVLC